MTPTATPALELVNLRMNFGLTEILRGVHLQVQAGERIALIGPNGAGKSTVFNLVSGRMAPSAGQVFLQGRRIDGMRPHQIHRWGLARSFQVTSVFPTLSVADHLRCAVLWHLGYRHLLLRWGRREALVRERVDALLEATGLAGRREEPAGQLPYAQQRMLEIAVTLAGDAPVVLLDEPTAGMSHSETQQVVRQIRQLVQGRTLLMVEHDMGVVFELADRIAVLVGGEVIAFDTPQRIRANARVQAAYLGGAMAGEGA